ESAYLQTLSDLGVVGFAARATLFATGVTLGVRAARRTRPLALPSIVGLLWLLVVAGVWNGLGLVAGIPLDALTWFAVGLIGAAAAWPGKAGPRARPRAALPRSPRCTPRPPRPP